MAYTFLQAVVKTLERVGVVQGTNPLTSLTDSGRQNDIDVAVQVWNEAIQQLYSVSNKTFSKEGGSSTITLATGTREYTLPTDLEQIIWPLIEETNGYEIYAYAGGYNQMRKDQPQPASWTGRPLFAAINPINGMLRVDTAPESGDNGLAYVIFYDKRLSMSAAADLFPFSDTVVDALVAVTAELWRRSNDQPSDAGILSTSLGRAARYLTQNKMRTRW